MHCTTAFVRITHLLSYSAFHPSGVAKWVVIHVFTWITEVETIQAAD